MTDTIEDRLTRLGIELPVPAIPAANYVPVVQTGNLLFVAGQLPMSDGKISCSGRLGDNVSLEDGQAAARLCAINLIAQINSALNGDLGRVRRVVRLGGFVASADTFTDQSMVVNGASDLMVEVFGEAGRHARAAVGVNTLPLGACVEIEGLFEIS